MFPPCRGLFLARCAGLVSLAGALCARRAGSSLFASLIGPHSLTVSLRSSVRSFLVAPAELLAASGRHASASFFHVVNACRPEAATCSERGSEATQRRSAEEPARRAQRAERRAQRGSDDQPRAAGQEEPPAGEHDTDDTEETMKGCVERDGCVEKERFFYFRGPREGRLYICKKTLSILGDQMPTTGCPIMRSCAMGSLWCEP